MSSDRADKALSELAALRKMREIAHARYLVQLAGAAGDRQELPRQSRQRLAAIDALIERSLLVRDRKIAVLSQNDSRIPDGFLSFQSGVEGRGTVSFPALANKTPEGRRGGAR